MSEFDKEAEREKLREQFARDEEKRKSTQRMSELLLKGATMTNKHCDTCGDPIFRYQGQEFCPTCQNAQVGQSAQSTQNTQSAESAQTAEQDAADESQVAPSPGTENESDDVEVAPEPPRSTDPSQSNEQSPPQRTRVGEHEDATVAEQSTSTAATSANVHAATTPPSQSASGDLSEARAALGRTVTRYATAAENADDPRRAKELLSAAREAAETLSALNR